MVFLFLCFDGVLPHICHLMRFTRGYLHSRSSSSMNPRVTRVCVCVFVSTLQISPHASLSGSLKVWSFIVRGCLFSVKGKRAAEWRKINKEALIGRQTPACPAIDQIRGRQTLLASAAADNLMASLSSVWGGVAQRLQL